MISALFDSQSLKTLAYILSGLLIVYHIVQLINKELKIRALGGHARRIPTWLPFDLDMIHQSVKAAMNHQNLELWNKWFRSTSSSPCYTVETAPCGRRIIFTADPENIKAILATQFNDYGKGQAFHEEWKDFLGDSIFTTDLDQWHASRQLIRPQFIKDRVSDLEVFEEHVQVLIRKIEQEGSKKTGKPGGEIDISDLFFRFTLDAATHFLLGSSVDSLELPEQDFAEAFAEAQRVQNIIARSGPLNRLVPRKSFFRSIRTINDFVSPFISTTLSLSPFELSTKSKSESGYTFLHALASFTRDRTILRDQLVAVLLAGRDTTAATLSWTFYELARHPVIVSRLRNEILTHVGIDKAPTYADLKNMRYLQNVLSETLRLYPAIPFNIRIALKDTTLPRGGGLDGLSPIGILKDTQIAYSTLVMQRREDLMDALTHHPSSSPRPSFHTTIISDTTEVAAAAAAAAEQDASVESFSPSRWETWQPKAWHYLPFNGGPRICIGQQFALTEMAYTIVRLLQRFERVEDFMSGGEDAVERGGGAGGMEEKRRKPCLKAEIVLQPGEGVRVGLS